MREKGRKRKDKKILIRVNRDEKRLAEVLSKAEGKNTSEFFRSLLKEREERETNEDYIIAAVEVGCAKALAKVMKKKRRRK